jgi:hypothetical protein
MKKLGCIVLGLLLFGGSLLDANAYTINFDELTDLTPVTNQYNVLGVEFSGATVITAGISLNEFEFPPFSGSNVILDDAMPMTVTFNTPVVEISAYFTYLMPVTVTAYNSLFSVVDMVTSSYFSNLALSGDPGSSPNEFLQVAYSGGISYLEITGDPTGGSFTLDNFTVTTSVDEPGTMLLLMTGLIVLMWFKRNKLRTII